MSAARTAPAIAGLDVLERMWVEATATVFRARRAGGECVLTVFDPGRDLTTVLRERRRHAALVAMAGHPRLPRALEIGIVDDRVYQLDELVPGRALADLDAGRVMPVRPALALLLDVVEPLAALHGQGLVHLDLTPRALMIGDDGTARLRDAGGRFAPGPRPAAAGGTTPAALGYQAPELSGAVDRPVDGRTDLYALGAVLFECLTGTPPFVAPDIVSLRRSHVADGPPDPRELVGDLPPAVVEIVSRLLAIDPDARYPRGDELAVDLHRVLDGPERLTSPRPPTVPRICGRDRELNQMLELWDQARRGRGRGCALRGSAGVGVSRLIEEVQRIVARSGAPVLALECRADDPVPYGPLRRAIERLLREADGLPDDSRQHLRDRVRAAAADAAPLVGALSPALAGLLRTPGLPDADRQDQFAASLARFVTELARLSGGLLMTTDDADLVDPGTLRVLSHLAIGMASAPLMTIGGLRTDRHMLPRQHPMMAAIQAATDLDLVLAPLDGAGVADLVSTRLAGLDLDSRAGRGLTGHGGGNPYAVLAHLRAVADAGLITPHRSGWGFDDAGDDRLGLPETPRGLAWARLAGIDPDTRRLLLVAAVCGRRFRPATAGAAAGLDPARTHAVIADASRHGLLEPAGGGDVRFRDQRVMDVLLDDPEPAALAELHRTIADLAAHDLTTAAPEEVWAAARHYLLGGRVSGPAYGVCRAAGELALAAHAPGRAIPYLEHAVDLETGDPRLLRALGLALQREGRYPAARRRLEEALVVERDGVERARILLRLTELHRADRNTPKARTTIQWGLAELDAALPDSRPGRALAAIRAGLLAALMTLTGWGFGGARDRWRDRAELLVALHQAGSYLATINLQPGTLLMHRLLAARSAARLGAGPQYALSQAGGAFVAALLGWRRFARRGLARAAQAAQELGDPQLEARVEWFAGAAEYVGRTDDGERWMRCLDERGHLLEAEPFSDAVAALTWDAAIQGRDEDARRWSGLGRLRATFTRTDEMDAMVTVPAVALVASGRAAEANAELHRLRGLLAATDGARSVQINLALAELFALVEQDRLGEEFEIAVRRFESLGPSRVRMLRPHRAFYLLLAQGRLGQCRAAKYPAAGIAVADRVRAARVALRRLRSVADTPLLRAAHAQCRAELLVLEGRPREALELLARIAPHEEAPLVGFEIARTTARALLGAGDPAQARRQVLAALAVAEQRGWTDRRARLALEFGLRPGGLGGPDDPPAAGGAMPGASPAAPTVGAGGGPSRPEVGPESALGVLPADREVDGAVDGAVDRENELAGSLRDALMEMSAASGPDEVLELLVATAARVLPGGRVWLVRTARRPATGGRAGAGRVVLTDLPAPGSVTELALDPELRGLIAAGQVITGGGDSITPPQLRRLLAGCGSWSLVPLSSDDEPVGVLVMASARPDAYTGTEQVVAGTVAAMGMSAYARSRLLERMQELTGTDDLTGVRSLRHVVELAGRDLQAARRTDRPLVVMVADIDHLTQVNRRYGREAGDDVIREVAARFDQVIRDTDLLGRYGDDEFVIVLSPGDDDGIEDGGLEVAERLLNSISRATVPSRAGPLPITVTIGLAALGPDDAGLASLTARAETALHEAKLDGRNRVRRG